MSYEVREVFDLEAILEELKALHRACHAELADTADRPFAFRYDLLAAYWHGGVYRIFGAFHEGHLVGHASGFVTRSPRTDELIAVEDVLYVLPEHRKGVGTMLTDATVAAARSVGVSRYRVTIPKGNLQAKKLAERAQFNHVGDIYEMRFT